MQRDFYNVYTFIINYCNRIYTLRNNNQYKNNLRDSIVITEKTTPKIIAVDKICLVLRVMSRYFLKNL